MDLDFIPVTKRCNISIENHRIERESQIPKVSCGCNEYFQKWARENNHWKMENNKITFG